MTNLFKPGFSLRFFLTAFFLVFSIGSVVWLSTGSAFAHETRDIDGGKYQFRVGFIDEPTYQGLENGLELTVCTGQCQTKPDSNGVLANGLTGAFDTLKAEVIYGPSTMPLTLVAVPYQPGKYDARFIPTRTGNYTFHITGTLNSDKIDERFTSSPDTFDSVQDLTAVQFPDKPGYNSASSSAGSTGSVPPATTSTGTAAGGPTAVAVTASAATPAGGTPASTAATPVAAVSTSNTAPAGASAADLQALQQQITSQAQALDTAKSNASSANTLGLIGLIVGIVGLVVAAVAIFMSRSKAVGTTPKPRREIEGG